MSNFMVSPAQSRLLFANALPETECLEFPCGCCTNSFLHHHAQALNDIFRCGGQSKQNHINKLVNSYGHGHGYQTRCAKPAFCVLPILLVMVRVLCLIFVTKPSLVSLVIKHH